MEVYYTPGFIRTYKKIPHKIQKKFIDVEQIFRKTPHASALRTHPLQGKLKGYYAFSVTFSYRVLFTFEPDGVTFIDIGTHGIYT